MVYEAFVLPAGHEELFDDSEPGRVHGYEATIELIDTSPWYARLRRGFEKAICSCYLKRFSRSSYGSGLQHHAAEDVLGGVISPSGLAAASRSYVDRLTSRLQEAFHFIRRAQWQGIKAQQGPSSTKSARSGWQEKVQYRSCLLQDWQGVSVRRGFGAQQSWHDEGPRPKP